VRMLYLLHTIEHSRPWALGARSRPPPG
jgi:hypothetical protein